jgi:hypothetical protein
MRSRAALFAACLLWLAYESHFSPSFFVATVGQSIADIMGGLDAAIAADTPVRVQTAVNDKGL